MTIVLQRDGAPLLPPRPRSDRSRAPLETKKKTVAVRVPGGRGFRGSVVDELRRRFRGGHNGGGGRDDSGVG